MDTAHAIPTSIPLDSPGVRVAEALALSFLIGASGQARLWLPFTPVPITGQTLAVLGGGAVLGGRFGMLAVLFYLIEGALGAPFFAGGAAGAPCLLGPTAGYLLGFLPAAGLTGWLASRGWDRSPVRAAGAMAFGSAVIFAFGLAWLSRFIPADRLLGAGLLPFLTGDAIKIAVGAAVLPLWRRVKDGIEA